MNRPTTRTGTVLIGLTLAALAVRVVAALVVESVARRSGSLCLFDDTAIYWSLAGSIHRGLPYSVDQFGVAHKALRTPGYPLFLAACQATFGARGTLGARLVQSLLGAACVPMVYALVRRVWPDRSARVAMIAAGLAALEPYWAASAALLLSEAAFVPLMLAMLWGLSALWPSPFVGWALPTNGTVGRAHPAGGRAAAVALATGLAAGAAVLVKPSWALAVPAAMLGLVLATRSVRDASLVGLGAVAILGPWWARNAREFGRFVPTALWAGASLYDGLNPKADGSSDMSFLGDPRFVRLGEVDQDRALRAEAIDFAGRHPSRVATLAAIKAGRFWSPWPNARQFRSSWVNLASAAATLPLFALLGRGAWRCRRDARALVLMGGPLVYFFALHVIFVSSIRYRIPAEVPAYGLMAMGWGGRAGAEGVTRTVPSG